ncbi:hotdog fold thioesterase [Bradyrhizobium sp. CSA207]|uniref:PaaI family thioesterase n=1 Tax=Bradyrhizobium sp. CSA207 TaxID=2698826 RepID=UPI0023AE840E|nr:PaaI family thioesterase [Bradyrhizobium sp. CSA207]MDE5441104.1 hotdog fold thioesterase [Bradyrhizobium sp. CSA207]
MNDAAANLPPGAELLGREWLGLDEGGRALIRFQAQPAFTNRHGTIQGGFLAAMLDSATGMYALAALSPDLTVVTKSLNTRFLKPATVGPITAQVRVIERTERDMIVQAELIDTEGRIVADATARLRILARDRVMQPRR